MMAMNMQSPGEQLLANTPPGVVEAMLDELETDPVFLPSAFWRELSQKNMKMLELEGLSNFKRTLSQNYYNWMITSPHHRLFRHAFLTWLRRPNLLPLKTKIEEIEQLRLTTTDQRVSLSPLRREIYRVYVTFVWTLMTEVDTRNLRKRVSEPEVGNPIRVWDGDKLLSQDLANSIVECNAILDLLADRQRPRVAEVGAGYGRLAHVFTEAQPGQYFIFDIPPALAVAQWYLERVLGPERLFKFRPFETLESVRDEMSRASVVFMSANQIRKFPDGYFDLVLSISTLPELRQDQADLYLSLFQRLSRSHIFLKQWKRWRNPQDGTDLTMDSYKLGPDWKLVLDRTDHINPMFFNRAWAKAALPHS